MLYLGNRQTVGSHNAVEENSQLVKGGQGGWQVPSHTHAGKPAPVCSDLEDRSQQVGPSALPNVHMSVRHTVARGIPLLTTL